MGLKWGHLSGRENVRVCARARVCVCACACARVRACVSECPWVFVCLCIGACVCEVDLRVLFPLFGGSHIRFPYMSNVCMIFCMSCACMCVHMHVCLCMCLCACACVRVCVCARARVASQHTDAPSTGQQGCTLTRNRCCWSKPPPPPGRAPASAHALLTAQLRPPTKLKERFSLLLSPALGDVRVWGTPSLEQES